MNFILPADTRDALLAGLQFDKTSKEPLLDNFSYAPLE